MPEFPSFTKTYHHTSFGNINEANPSISAAGKVVLVTGGGNGIGKATAISFARAGARAAAIIGRTEATLLRAKAEIEEGAVTASRDTGHHPVVVRTFTADILDAKAIEAAFSAVRAETGPIDVLVSNAGYLSEQFLVATSPLDDYWHAFEVNVMGGIIVAQAFLNGAAAASATLINVTSGVCHIPYISGYSGYAASKLATTKIMDYVQQENPALRVFNIQPGVVETDMSRKSGLDMTIKADISLPAAFCVWLASPESDFLKGRLVWSNWDVTKLKERKEEIKEKDLLRVQLLGWLGAPYLG
ncbi:hypothetical protein MMC18_007644 [Xylographa bjoerkii]|nr:hypothetical protein [Xylographa bjoerkii]